MDSWSGGISQTESSIMEAYVDLIKNSKHYIYIEVSVHSILLMMISRTPTNNLYVFI